MLRRSILLLSLALGLMLGDAVTARGSQTVCEALAVAAFPRISAKATPSKRMERRCMTGNYFEAYSDGSDCKPSTQSTVTLSSFDSNIEMVAFGLTAGSTRAFKIWERYCD